jgi:histidyl-tRNA synthetase
LEEGSFRVLRCEGENCLKVREKVPIILDHLCQNCNHHLRNVLELIEENGVVYDSDPALVSDSDCYNKTIFEIYDTESKRLLAHGGRHDYLGEQLSKKQLPASGATVCLENVIAVMKENHTQIREKARQKIFFAIVGEQAKKKSMHLMNKLREHGIITIEAVGKKALKPQLKQAEKLHVNLALIFGQKEAYEGSVIVRDMKSGSQETVILDNLVEEVKRRLKNL